MFTPPSLSLPKAKKSTTSRLNLLHHEEDLSLAGDQRVRRLVVLPSREAKNHLHLRLAVLDARGFVTGTADTNELESLDSAVEARAEGAIVAILGELVVLVLALS